MLPTHLLLPLLLLLLTACSTPISKPEALDLTVITRTPGGGALLSSVEPEELVVEPGPAWMGLPATTDALVFAGLRAGGPDGEVRYCLVTHCDPASDRLVLSPLPDGMTPLRFLQPTGNGGSPRPDTGPAITLSLETAVKKRLLASPLPTPRNVYAVAANVPSHLQEDLAISDVEESRSVLRESRARVFRKYPPVAAPEATEAQSQSWQGIIGPHDDIIYPETIILPPEADQVAGTGIGTQTRLDYEVEVGIVMGRDLTLEDAAEMSDDDLRASVAGLILVSDVKARNPQVLLKVARHSSRDEESVDPHLVTDESLDEALGTWDKKVCDWWSHAASWGDYAALGPFFVVPPTDRPRLDHAVITARSYGPQETRGHPVPEKREAGRFYLRQCSVITEEDGHKDALIWRIPDVLRSILATGNVLFAEGTQPALREGDVISLGTPGGVILTARSQWLFNLISTFLSTWTPLDWHDFFFGDDAPLYLNPGDELLFWAEGLGYQRHVIRVRKDEP